MALQDSRRCAIGTWAARGRQHIVMIRPVDGGLVMQQLLYKSEVRSIDDVDIPKMDVSDAELKLAKQLIDAQASSAFDAGQYKDEVAARIEAAVQRKVEGHEITMTEEPATSTGQVIDLMEALRASLEKRGVKPGAAAADTTPATKAEAPARKTAKKAAPPPPAAEPARKGARKR
jgi:DNA end-binding protein Ku